MHTNKKTPLIVFKTLPSFNAQDIKSIRIQSGLNRRQFSELLGVSIKTVQAWERGVNIPNGSAKRLLQLMKEDNRIIDRLTQYKSKRYRSGYDINSIK